MSSPITAQDVRSWLDGIQRVSDTPKVMQQYVDENVVWTVTCPGDSALGKTTPIAGTYNSRDAFVKGALASLGPLFTDGINLEIVDVFVQPSESNDASERHLTKAVLEMKGTATMKNGKGWNNYYAWIIHFSNGTKKAVRVRAYLDSAAVNTAFAQ